MTNVTVMTDKANNRIYHLVDKRLYDMGDYAMSRVLESVKFEGDGRAFVNRIKEAVTNVLNQNMFGGNIGSPNDATTISIDSVEVNVRDALSNGVDLHGYNRLIWTAFTPLETHQTTIHFLGTTNFMPRGNQ